MSKKLLAYVNRGEISKDEVCKLTHINIAFGRLRVDGTVDTRDHDKLKRVKQFHEWNPKIKVCLSIVPADPDAFTVCCASEKLREITAQNLAKIVVDYELDGIDLDWEYPCFPSNGANANKEDRHNFTLLCEAIRRNLDAMDGRHYLLTIAAGADVYYIHCVQVKELMKYVDYICLMTYDLKCGFHALAGHHTALYSNVGDVFMNSCDQALRLFHEAGVPKERLLMGAAFYSRKWEGIEDRNHGLLQICKYGGGYGPDYTELVEHYVNKNGYVRYWDDEAKAPYLFNGDTFLSYDDEESLRLKAEYVKQEGYGGIFYWEHKCDATGTLLETLYQNIKTVTE